MHFTYTVEWLGVVPGVGCVKQTPFFKILYATKVFPFNKVRVDTKENIGSFEACLMFVLGPEKYGT